MKGNKILENMVIFVLIGVVVIMLWPVLQKMFERAQIDAAENKVYTLVDNVKNLYLEENQNAFSEVSLPFTVIFKDGSYKTICSGSEVELETKLKGKLPISGTILYGADSELSVINLEYKNFVCSMPPAGEVSCEKKDSEAEAE